MAPGRYEFRPMSAGDMALVGGWLAAPHVREWWGDPVRGVANIEGHLHDPAADIFVVSYQDTPIGYLQCYDAHAGADLSLRDQPLGTRGIDQFIGEPAFLDRGHGSAFIRVFVEALFEAGVPRVVTDPNPRNARAIRAYAKAGFRAIDHRTTVSGEVLLMGCDPGKMSK
jgi:aminoglycoside 6'-N-acetyltransferase